MKYLLIQNGLFNNKIKDILIKEDKIIDTDFKGDLPDNCQIIDARGKRVAPGFIDIHLHGGGGFDFMDCTQEAMLKISETHLKCGATTIVPTAVSSSFDKTLEFIEMFKKTKSSCPNFLGIHLEGPYISPLQKGAHKEKYLHCPNVDETEQLLSAGKGIISTITAAPELEGAMEFAEIMAENGVLMSVGHSNATSDVVLEAFNRGFSHVTHLYSATTTVRKVGQTVMAGIVEAAYLSDSSPIELIADGCHAAKDALRLAVKIKGADKVALVTDALRPAGTDVKESWLGEKIPENRVIIEDGVAKLPDRSFFAGSIATANIVLKKACTHYGLSFADAIKMVTETPAKIMKLAAKGRIEKGFDADIVLLDNALDVCTVIKNGELV